MGWDGPADSACAVRRSIPYPHALLTIVTPCIITSCTNNHQMIIIYDGRTKNLERTSKKMLTLFYSPHATSVDNEAGRSSGHADIPLAATGLQQAQQRGQDYATIALDAIFCSDLQRATKTAELAFIERHIPIVPDARLREYDYGDDTQKPNAWVEQEFAQRITEPFPNGESACMVVQRVGTFLRSIFQHYDGKTIVIIGHRATKYGIEYWCGSKHNSVEEIVCTPWEWRDIPIWRYELNAHNLERPLIARPA
jgi:alpha-ribazole phosphatase/probable phosphoglycerate mutase